mgnify:CR=1 FL=1
MVHDVAGNGIYAQYDIAICRAIIWVCFGALEGSRGCSCTRYDGCLKLVCMQYNQVLNAVACIAMRAILHYQHIQSLEYIIYCIILKYAA